MSTLSARLQAAGCACAKGSITDSSGKIDPALLPLFQQSAGNVMNIQNQNPLGNYMGSNPMQVAGPNEVQRYGLDNIMGAGGPNQLDAMALQDILRAPAMAQAGPTTGSYDPSQEMDLSQYFGALQSPHGQVPQDWGQVGVSGIGPDVGPTKLYQHTGTNGPNGPNNPPDQPPITHTGGNPNPVTDPNPHHQGQDPPQTLDNTMTVSPRAGGASADTISPGSGASMSNIGPLAALASGGSGGSGFYRDPSGRLRVADPSQAGRIEGTNVHGQGVVDSSGVLQQLFHAASQGQGTGQLGAGSMSARPTDPAMAAQWDAIMKNHPGATVGTQQSNGGLLGANDMTSAQDQAQLNAYANRYKHYGNWQGAGTAEEAAAQNAARSAATPAGRR